MSLGHNGEFKGSAGQAAEDLYKIPKEQFDILCEIHSVSCLRQLKRMTPASYLLCEYDAIAACLASRLETGSAPV